MKKLVIVLMIMVALPLMSSAQNQPYRQGDRLLNIGTSFGFYDFGYFGQFGRRNLIVPPISVAYEVGYHEYFSLGLFAGYSAWGYRTADQNYFLQNFGFGARGSFHFWELFTDFIDADIESEKLDVYLIGSLGLVIENNNFNDPNINSTRLRGSPILFSLGARYYINPKFAFFLEGGQGFNGYGVIGVTFKR